MASEKDLSTKEEVSEHIRLADSAAYDAEKRGAIGAVALDFTLVLNNLFEELGHAYPAISKAELTVLIGRGMALAALVQGAILTSQGVDSTDERVARYKKAVTPDLLDLLRTMYANQGRNVNVVGA